MTSSWQLILLWGVFVGLGTGSMALAFVATVVDRWFVEKRGLVTGILTDGGAAGQLVFLPVLAKIAETYDWKRVAFRSSISDERSVGKEWGRTCRCRWAPDNETNNKTKKYIK